MNRLTLALIAILAIAGLYALFGWLRARQAIRLNNDNQQAFEPDVVTRGEG